MDDALPPNPETTRVIPWEDPNYSFFDGLIESLRLLALNPSEAFRRIPAAGGIGRPLFFAIAVGWVSIAVAVFWNVLFQGMWMPFMDSMDDVAGMGAMYSLTIGWALVMVVIAPLFVVIGVFIAAAILHLMLMIVGGASSGFEATVRVVCYTYTAQLAGIIPFCGGIIATIWTAVLLVMGFSIAHRTTQGKALIAVLLPIVICCVMGVVLLMIVGGIAGLAAATQ